VNATIAQRVNIKSTNRSRGFSASIAAQARINLQRDKAVATTTSVPATTKEEKQQQESIARPTTQSCVLGALPVKYWTLVVLFVSNALREKRRRVLLDRVPPAWKVNTKTKTVRPCTVARLALGANTAINPNKKQLIRVKIALRGVGPLPLVTVLRLRTPRVPHVAKANTIRCPDKVQTHAPVAPKANTTTLKVKTRRTIAPIAQPVHTVWVEDT